jgi:hypothetical protein
MVPVPALLQRSLMPASARAPSQGQRWRRVAKFCLLVALFVPPGLMTEGLRAQGKRWWRMAEPCLLMALFVTLGMLLPLAFPCTPTQCYIVQGETAPVCPPGVSPNVQCAPALGRGAPLSLRRSWVCMGPWLGSARQTKTGCHGMKLPAGRPRRRTCAANTIAAIWSAAVCCAGQGLQQQKLHSFRRSSTRAAAWLTQTRARPLASAHQTASRAAIRLCAHGSAASGRRIVEQSLKLYTYSILHWSCGACWVCAHGPAATGRRIVEQSLELYTCSGAAGADSETPAEARNGTLPRSYNELATLMSVTGARAVSGRAERARRQGCRRHTRAGRGWSIVLAMHLYFMRRRRSEHCTESDLAGCRQPGAGRESPWGCCCVERTRQLRAC